MKGHRFIDALIKGEELLKKLTPRRRSEAAQSSNPAPGTGFQLERVQQLKVRNEGREELDKKSEELKQKLKDKGVAPKPPPSKPPPLQISGAFA